MKKKYSPLYVLIVFVLFLAFMLTGGAYIQGKLGMPGVAVTEIVIALLAVGAAILQKEDLKEFFPLMPPSPRTFFGSALIYAGAWCAMIGLTTLLTFLFPQAAESAEGLSTLIGSVSPALAILVAALLPAICEELLFRGYIQSSMKRIGNKWIVIVLVGVLFGIAHMDPLRFVPTSILGMTFAYFAFETGSIFLGMLFHFINNVISVVTTFLVSDLLPEQAEEAMSQLDSFGLTVMIGSCLVYFALAVMLLYLGERVLHKKKITAQTFVPLCAASGVLFVIGVALTAYASTGSVTTTLAAAMLYSALILAGCFILTIVLKRKKPKTAVIVTVCIASFLLFAGGVAMTLLSMPDPVYDTTKQLTDPDTPIEEYITVEQDGLYQITVVGMCSNCTIKWTMRGEEDAVVAYESDRISQNEIFELSKGDYFFTYSIKKGEDEDSPCNAQIRVQISPLTTLLPEAEKAEG